MPRLFVALPFPDEVKDRLLALKIPEIPGMRRIAGQELHLTLHFLGEVAAGDAVREALASVQMSAFTITIMGVGRFPPEGQPTVLWAGVENSPSLTAFHQSIGSALTKAIGFQPEARPYSPHITLARLKDPAPPGVVEQFLDENKDFRCPSVLLDRCALFSSVLVNDVPQYRLEAEFCLSEHQREQAS